MKYNRMEGSHYANISLVEKCQASEVRYMATANHLG